LRGEGWVQVIPSHEGCSGKVQFSLTPKDEATMPSIDQIIVWIVVGLLGGSLAGLIMTWDREGFGLLRNLGLGLAGALVGGLLFRLFGLLPGLDKIAISLRDIVAALVGSLIVLTARWFWRRSKTPH
jgi:uncharacterized membrane protein YeaQ/YmgE (transglycosylase-associated protein family)